MEYSEELLRGIQNKDYVENGYALAHAFYFEDNPSRTDDNKEQSINWFDDEGALEQIFELRKDNGEFKFKKGYVKLKRSKLDEISLKPVVNHTLSYERHPIPDKNQYHGNILLKKEVPSNISKMIAAWLAMECTSVKPNPNVQ
jgi:hypothetical protein